MQHAAMRQNPEGRFADGLGEYETLYGGGLQWDYNRPSKRASATVQELDASPPLPPSRNPKRLISKFAGTSYDLAAHVPQYRKHAEGLQVAEEVPPRTSSLGYSPDLPVYEISARPAMAYSISSPSTSPAITMHERHLPLGSPSCSSQAPTLVPQSPSSPDMPQPLAFKRAATMPMTPPMSSSGSSEGGIRDSMASLARSEQQPLPLRLPKGPALLPAASLSRMGTVSSTTSGSVDSAQLRLSSVGSPSNPLSRPHFSVAAFTSGAYENEAANMTLDQAKAEITRQLEHKNTTTSRKGSCSSSIMKFSLKRSNTAGSGNGVFTPEALSQVLEEVSQEGSLSLVKAVVAMGADPTGKAKRSKNQALAKATAAGHARVVDFLLRNGAKYGDIRLKVKHTPTDYALLSAAYKEHAELVSFLVASHGANPMTEQWPREIEDTQHYWAESQVRLAKSSVLDGISRWKNVEVGMSVMKFIMGSSRFDPSAFVSGLFDNKSELQTASYQHRPWQTTYEVSALACFSSVGWAGELLREFILDKPNNDQILSRR